MAAFVLISPPLLAAPQSAPRPDTAKPSLIVNTAGATELQQLPGIGERTAPRIVEYRQKNGPFKKIEELLEVREGTRFLGMIDSSATRQIAAATSGPRGNPRL